MAELAGIGTGAADGGFGGAVGDRVAGGGR